MIRLSPFTLFGLTALVLITSSLAMATNKNAGTSGAVFLKMGAGARPTAMGNAFVGIADDVNAAYFNPAGLARLQRAELTAMHTQWIEGLDYNYGAYAQPMATGVLAFSAATLRAADIEKRDTSEGFQGTFTNLDAAYTLSYGKKWGELYSIGLTGRFIKQKIDATSANGYGGDIGVLRKFDRRPLTVGLAVRHIGSQIKFNEEGDPQPLTVDTGLGYRFLRDKLLVGLDVLKPRDNSVKFGVGLEWKGKLSAAGYALRTGFNSSSTDADSSGLSVGAGLHLNKFDLDFSWVPMGNLGNTFRYSAHVKF